MTASDSHKLFKEICCYVSGIVLVPLNLFFSVFWGICNFFRDIFVYPLADIFKNHKKEEKDFYQRLVIGFGRLLIMILASPFWAITLIVSSPYLLYRWVKSAIVGFKKLVDFITSNQKEILVSNRLDWIERIEWINDENIYAHIDFGYKIKTSKKAIQGYIFGIYRFDVSDISDSILEYLFKQKGLFLSDNRQYNFVVTALECTGANADHPLWQAIREADSVRPEVTIMRNKILEKTKNTPVVEIRRFDGAKYY